MSGPSPPVIFAIFAASSLTCSCCCMFGPTGCSPSALGSLPGLLVLALSAKRRAAGLWKLRKAAVGFERSGRVRRVENGFIGGIVEVLGCVLAVSCARKGSVEVKSPSPSPSRTGIPGGIGQNFAVDRSCTLTSFPRTTFALNLQSKANTCVCGTDQSIQRQRTVVASVTGVFGGAVRYLMLLLATRLHGPCLPSFSTTSLTLHVCSTSRAC